MGGGELFAFKFRVGGVLRVLLCFAVVFEQHRDSGVCPTWFKGKRVGKGPKCQQRRRSEHVVVKAELQTPFCPWILLEQVVHLSHTGFCLLLALAMLQVSMPESAVWNAQRICAQSNSSAAEELLAHQHNSRRLAKALNSKRLFRVQNEKVFLLFKFSVSASKIKLWLFISYSLGAGCSVLTPHTSMRALAALQDQTVIDGIYRTQQEHCVAQTPNYTNVPHSFIVLGLMNSQQICHKQIKSLRNQSYQW